MDLLLSTTICQVPKKGSQPIVVPTNYKEKEGERESKKRAKRERKSYLNLTFASASASPNSSILLAVHGQFLTVKLQPNT